MTGFFFALSEGKYPKRRLLNFFGTTFAILIPLHTIERFSEKKPWANAPRAFFFERIKVNGQKSTVKNQLPQQSQTSRFDFFDALAFIAQPVKKYTGIEGLTF
jgi:hypothetical protein